MLNKKWSYGSINQQFQKYVLKVVYSNVMKRKQFIIKNVGYEIAN
jgi:hypothetical protein